mmetsp:Transcript_39600/g.92621  ORF Transcript_39600/g.92621 Transcript_39600/m.92621 type:complete len:120 (-) Transcript_39600:142-501(-)
MGVKTTISYLQKCLLCIDSIVLHNFMFLNVHLFRTFPIHYSTVRITARLHKNQNYDNIEKVPSFLFSFKDPYSSSNRFGKYYYRHQVTPQPTFFPNVSVTRRTKTKTISTTRIFLPVTT